MAVRIGFDDEKPIDSIFEENEEDTIKEVDENRLKAVVFSERRIAQFLKDYDCSVVNDFGDDYHYTDEERAKKNKYYEIFKKFTKCKHKYRRIDQYVIAMREMLEVLDFVAENNGIYDPEKFKIMYIKGDIYISGLYVPKLIGKAKKYISFEYLTDFILSDEDPSNLIRKKTEEVYDEEDYEEFSKTMFDEGEMEECLVPQTEEEMIINSTVFDEDEDDAFNRNIITSLTGKKFKELLKNNPEIVRALKDRKEEARSLANMSRYAYELTSDDLDQIDKYDRKHNLVNSGNMPEFKGDIMNDDDYNRYMAELKEWEEANTYDNYHGKMKSLEEIKELELKQVLEANNWNLRNLYNNREKEILLKKKMKEDKKREKELRQQLVEIDNRRRRRMGEEVDEDSSRKSKKKKKKVEKVKKEFKKASKDILSDIASSDALDWTSLN